MERRGNYDLLRIVAQFFVVVLHVSSSVVANPSDPEFFSYNFYSMLSRFSVPVFVMLSGYFNMESMDVKKAFKKSLKLYIIILFWSLIYLLRNLYLNGGMELSQILNEMFLGHYHMWFLFMTIGLYLLTPILAPALKDLKNAEYFLILGLIFSVIPATLKIVMGERFIRTFALSFIDGFYFRMTGGFILYYVLGYYLGRKDIKHKGIWIALGAVAMAWSIYMQYEINAGQETLIYGYYDVMGIFAYLFSAGVFLIFKDLKVESAFVSKLSSLTLGIFLIHDLFIGRVGNFVGDVKGFIKVPLVSAIVFIISAAVVAILKKIPVVKDHLV